MTIRICVAGATGWTGSAVVRGVLNSDAFTLTGTVAQATAGRDIGQVIGLGENAGVVVSSSVAEALEVKTDVLVDYTTTATVKDHVLYAIERGIAVVVGTSGLTAQDYDDIEKAAESNGVGVVGGGNFSITATLMQRLALETARNVPQFEVLDYAWAEKEDVPSGTGRELAEKLGDVQQPKQVRSMDSLHGPIEARGATINGVQVHSVRLPGYTLRCGAVFGLEGERLEIFHEAGPSAAPYVAGTLLAAKKAMQVKGLVRGLDALLFK